MKLRSVGLTWREIDGSTVLLDLHSSLYLRSNGSGTFLLRQLTEERGRDELIAAFAERFAVGVPVATRDVDGFVSVLEERGLLASESDEPTP